MVGVGVAVRVAVAVVVADPVAVADIVAVAVGVTVTVAVAVVAVDVVVAVAVAVAVAVGVEVVAVAVAVAVAVVAVAVGVAVAVAVAVALPQAAGAIAIISAHHEGKGVAAGVYDVAACVPVEVLLNTAHPPVSLSPSAFRYMPVELNPVGGDAALLLILSYNHRTRSLLVVVIELAKGVVLDACWHSVVPIAPSVVDGSSPVI